MPLAHSSHALHVCLLALLVVLSAGVAPAPAADTLGLGIERLKTSQAATHVEAGELEYQEQRRIVIGRGEVMVRFGDRILHADEVRVDLAAQEFVATGNVLLLEGPNRLEGDRLEFNYGTGLGVIHNARGFLYPNTSFRGIEIRKVSERVYHIRDGGYTSCRVCLPATDFRSWELRGKEATLVLDDVFFVTHASAWVADGLPVFYTPVVALPLGPRRSGFLIPRVGYGNTNGLSLRQAFYWAISESQDATIIGTYRSKRGFELGAGYRYILSPRAAGQWSGSYLRDRTEDLAGRNRWEIHGIHDQYFTPTLNLKADINFQSDSSIGRLIDRTLDERTARTIQTNAFVTQAAEAYNAMLRVEVSRDLTNTLDTRLTRLPELRFHLFDRSVFRLPLTAGGFGSATLFERNSLPDAARFDIAPRLRLPWNPAPWLGFMATGGVRETVYSQTNTGFGGLASRSLYDVGGSAETRFLRAFNVGGRELDQLVHVVAPRVSYLYAPFVDQQRFPQFDLEDFVSPQNHVTYGVENRFIGRFRDEEGNPSSREVLRLGVAQSFHFRPRTHVYSDNYLAALTPERVDNAVANVRPLFDTAGNPTGFSRADERQFSNLVLSFQASPHPLILIRGALGLNTSRPADEVTNLQLRLRYPGWGFLDLGYTNVAGQSLQAYLGTIGVTLTPELALTYFTRYDARRKVFFEHHTSLRYATCCWEVGVRWINREQGPGIPTENDVRVVFELKTGRGGLTPPPAGGGPPAQPPGGPTPDAGRPVDGLSPGR